MPDLRIIKGLFTSLIVPLSERGERWIKVNMYRHDIEITITVQTEYLNDLEEEFRKDKLIVEGSG